MHSFRTGKPDAEEAAWLDRDSFDARTKQKRTNEQNLLKLS